MFNFVSVTETKFSIQQAAEILGVDYSTVSRLLSRGRLGHFRIGDRKLIAESHLRDYLKANEKLPKRLTV